MKRFSVLVLLVSGVWLTFGSAHAVEQSAEDPSAQEALTVQEILQRDPSAEDYGESPRCIDTKRIRRINVLDDKHVVFEMSRDQFFLAQFERRLIQERTRAGLAAARARGRRGGRKPLQADDPKVRMAYMMYEDQSLTVSDICRTLRISQATFYRYVALGRRAVDNT